MLTKYQELIEKAIEARKTSYSPYSRFSVGASVLVTKGVVFTGCNIENSSYGLSICAERVAIFNAISSGFKKFKAMAIVSDSRYICTPCGACRQVMMQFSPEMDIIMMNLENHMKICKAIELLPDAFGNRQMN